MDMVQERHRLTADDWAEAALGALGEGGLAAVAVEPLAVRIGATKGSFYWHFANRDALVTAALALWEQRSTEARIAVFDAEPDPVARLRLLFTQVSDRAGADPAEIGIRAAAGHELVAPVLRRVTERRLGYVIALFEEIGYSHAESVHRGTLGYTAYIGHSDLAARLPGVLPIDNAQDLAGYVDTVLDLLLHDRPGPPA